MIRSQKQALDELKTTFSDLKRDLGAWQGAVTHKDSALFDALNQLTVNGFSAVRTVPVDEPITEKAPFNLFKIFFHQEESNRVLALKKELASLQQKLAQINEVISNVFAALSSRTYL